MSTQSYLRVALLTALASWSLNARASSTDKPLLKIDVTGKWSWASQRQNGGGREVTMTLKQDGEKISGTVSGTGFSGDVDIQEGAVKDGNVTFKVTRSRGGQEFTTTFSGRFSGDTIKGKVDTDMRGNKVLRDWEAHRIVDDPKPEDPKPSN